MKFAMSTMRFSHHEHDEAQECHSQGTYIPAYCPEHHKFEFVIYDKIGTDTFTSNKELLFFEFRKNLKEL